MKSSRKFIVSLLFMLTVTLGISAIWIGYRLSQQPSVGPDDFSALESIVTCNEEIIETFSSPTIDQQIWKIKSNINTTSFVDNNFSLVLDEDNFINDEQIETLNYYQGDFVAEFEVGDIQLSNPVGNEVFISFINPTDPITEKLVIRIKQTKISGEDRIQLLANTINNQTGEIANLDRISYPIKIFITREAGSLAIFYKEDIENKLLIYDKTGYNDVGKFAFGITRSANDFFSANFDGFKVGCSTSEIFPAISTVDSNQPLPTATIRPTNTLSATIPQATVAQQGPTNTPTPTSNVPIPTNTTVAVPTPTVANQQPQPTNTPMPNTSNNSSIQIAQSAQLVCSEQGGNLRIVYTVRITNSENIAKNINVRVELDNKVVNSQVLAQSITFGGVYADKVINWTNLSLPASGSVSLNYEYTIVSTAYGNYTTNVRIANVASGDPILSNQTSNYNCLPATALTNDQMIRVIIGLTMIIVGIIVYRARLYMDIGNIFWNTLGYIILPKFSKEFSKQYRNDFEKNIQKKIDNQKIK
jgi:hypothetical protein